MNKQATLTTLGGAVHNQNRQMATPASALGSDFVFSEATALQAVKQEAGMAFPAQYFYSVLEVAGRWGCTQTEVINYAMSDEINLVAGFSSVRFGTECAAGLMHVAGSEVRALFRPYGKGAKKIHVTQARQLASGTWTTITEPARGVRLTAADIMIPADGSVAQVELRSRFPFP